ncbi:MAG TPA: type III pantothenate kinase [Actinomycetota bacterium]
MLLAVDAGNTQTNIGLFERGDLQQHWSVQTLADRTADEHALVFKGLLEQVGLSFSRNVTGVVLSSVVPRVTQALREMVERYFHFEPVVVGPGVRTGMPIVTDNPREVGTDRVVNAIAAHERYGGPCIAVGIGTATTFGAVSDRGEFLGGAIAPGMQVSTNALVASTAQLRNIEFAAPRSVIGKTTVESIQAGVVFGHAGMIDAIVERMRDDLGASAPVVATGGLAPVVVPLCKTIDHHEPWLSLEGLQIIFERNARAD